MMTGLTDYDEMIRDGFAQAALQGLTSKLDFRFVSSNPDIVANLAYKLADSMEKERSARRDRMRSNPSQGS